MDWTGLLGRHPQQARSILSKLLMGRLVFTLRLDPVAGDAYHFAGEGRLDPLLDVITLPGQHNALVTPAGFEPVFHLKVLPRSQSTPKQRVLLVSG